MAAVLKKDTLSKVLKNEEYYRILVENLEEYAIIIIDTNGLVRSWNRGAQHLLQFKKSEILGQSGAAFFTDEDKMRRADRLELETARRRGRAADERWHKRK